MESANDSWSSYSMDSGEDTVPWMRYEDGGNSSKKWYDVDMDGTIRIPLYGIIFVTGLVGNVLVIVTLGRNRRLRAVTNVFLLNLAVSDLLLGVVCMPFTLIGALLREFVFGEMMCKALSYLQGVTVAVNAWTLVAISLERFYAVCQPLRSRRWQTSKHAAKVVLATWAAAFVLMAPIAWTAMLLSTPFPGKFKCREKWPSRIWERSFNVFLDTILLAAPLLVMAAAYFRIGLVLTREIPGKMPAEHDTNDPSLNGTPFMSLTSTADEHVSGPKIAVKWGKSKAPSLDSSTRSSAAAGSGSRSLHHQGSGLDANSVVSLGINSLNIERRLAIKKKVTLMLFVVVLEFFVCWTPIYVVNTVSSFQPELVYKKIGYFAISFFHLLSYISSCCNPITYCFMNRNFRREFLQTFSRLCFHQKEATSKCIMLK